MFNKFRQHFEYQLGNMQNYVFYLDYIFLIIQKFDIQSACIKLKFIKKFHFKF